ncbi:MAG: hypothetical protein K1060chlam1_01332 [Candidatus Anoxychlamydiales bacterium]|nr:hypothetical protein [Candidatus Anoxychlamydiales bacterium]
MALICIYGISRGGELALILGAWFPKYIQAIVAAIPSSVITSGEGDDLFVNSWSYIINLFLLMYVLLKSIK